MADLDDILDPTGDKFETSAGARVPKWLPPALARRTSAPVEVAPEAALPENPIPNDTTPSGAGSSARDHITAESQKEVAAANTSFLDLARAAVPSASVLFHVARHTERALGAPAAVEGYAPTPEDFKGMTQDEMEEASRATSPAELAQIKGDQSARRQSLEAMGNAGFYSQLGASMLASAPDEAIIGAVTPGLGAWHSAARITRNARRAEAMAAAVRAARSTSADDIAAAAAAKQRLVLADANVAATGARAASVRGVVTDAATSGIVSSGALAVVDSNFVSAEDVLLDAVASGAIALGIRGAQAAGMQVAPAARYVDGLFRKADSAKMKTAQRAADIQAEAPDQAPIDVQERIAREDAQTITKAARAVEDSKPEVMLDPEHMEPEPEDVEVVETPPPPPPAPPPAPTPRDPEAPPPTPEEAKAEKTKADDARAARPVQSLEELDELDDEALARMTEVPDEELYFNDEAEDLQDARDAGINFGHPSGVAFAPHTGAEDLDGPRFSSLPTTQEFQYGYSPKRHAELAAESRELLLGKYMRKDGTDMLFPKPILIDNGSIKANAFGYTGDGKIIVVPFEKDGAPMAQRRMDLPANRVGGSRVKDDTPIGQRFAYLQGTDGTALVGAEFGQRAASAEELGEVLKDLSPDDQIRAMWQYDAASNPPPTAKQIEDWRAAGVRVVVLGDSTRIPDDALQTAIKLAEDFIPDGQILMLRDGPENYDARTTIHGDHLIEVDFHGDKERWSRTLLHEVGHMVTTEALRSDKIPSAVKSALREWHRDNLSAMIDARGLDEAIDAMLTRGTLSNHMADNLGLALKLQQPGREMESLFELLERTTGLGRRVDDADWVEGSDYKQRRWEVARSYVPMYAEALADNFERYIERAIMGVDSPYSVAGLPQSIKDHLAAAARKAFAVFKRGIEDGVYDMDSRFEDFMAAILARRAEGRITEAKVVASIGSSAGGSQRTRRRKDASVASALSWNMLKAAPTGPFASAGAVKSPNDVKKIHGLELQKFQSKDALSARVGIDSMPTGDRNERGTYKAVRTLWFNALNWNARNPYDNGGFSTVLRAAPGAQSAHTVLATSDNAMARYVASILLESPTGAGGGRTSTAAIRSALNLKKIMGNAVREYDGLALKAAKRKGKGYWEAVVEGKEREAFDREVFLEIEARRTNRPTSQVEEVRKAADVMEGVYQRSADLQRASGTIGNKLLPATSRGYHPHKLHPGKLMKLTPQQTRALADLYADQIIGTTGWEPEFGMQLAFRIIEHARVKAAGGLEIDANIHSTANEGIVSDALRSLGLSQQEVEAHMARFQRGGMSHVRQRLELDMHAPFPGTAGGPGILADMYSTDILSVARNQSARVAGESALAAHGIYGEAGLDLLRQAMTYGERGAATAEQLKAFDQVAAEFLGRPFGTAGTSLAVSRVTQGTSLLKLGGVVFNQLAESVNLATAVGAAKALNAVAGFRRLRAEIVAIREGRDPDGSLIRKMEELSGVDFGLDGYRVSAFLDNHGLEREVYGQETPGLLDRLLRGGTQAQAKLTLWRTVQAVQQRGSAEAITRHILEIVDGKRELNNGSDKDLGISANLIDRLRLLPGAIQKDGRGNITGFDPRGISPGLLTDLVAVVQRGVSQVVQETHIGERSAWNHSDLARILTQFRSYPITAIEKQWTRQRNIGGNARAMGIVLGAMSIAAPVYMARVALQSIGRDDQEEYLNERLDPLAIARATLNYTAGAGLAGDFIEALTDTIATDEDRREGTVLGRMSPSNPDRSVVGGIIGPGADVLTDVYNAAKAVGQIRDGESAREAVEAATRIMPGSRAPQLVPLFNALSAEGE